MKVARSRIKGSLVDLNRREVHSDRCRTSIGKPHFSISHKRHDEATRERSIKYHRAKLILDRRETLANAKKWAIGTRIHRSPSKSLQARHYETPHEVAVVVDGTRNASPTIAPASENARTTRSPAVTVGGSADARTHAEEASDAWVKLSIGVPVAYRRLAIWSEPTVPSIDTMQRLADGIGR